MHQIIRLVLSIDDDDDDGLSGNDFSPLHEKREPRTRHRRWRRLSGTYMFMTLDKTDQEQVMNFGTKTANANVGAVLARGLFHTFTVGL